MKLSKNFLRSENFPVTGVILISLLLRWVLIIRGGLFYHPDEGRYPNISALLNVFMQKGALKAIKFLANDLSHLGYRILATIPALIEHKFKLPNITSAIFFSFISVLNLYLLWKISNRIRMTPQGSRYVLLIVASSNSLLYFSRHLFPYDTSMFFGLWALYIGLGRSSSHWRSFVVGVLSFLGFITYNGYWLLAALAMVLPPIIKGGKLCTLAQKFSITSLGFFSIATPLLVIVSIATKRNPIEDFLAFSSTITQGSFSEGWSFPFEYLWHAEHFWFVIIVILSLYTILNFRKTNPLILKLGIGGILFIYLCLLLFSTGLHVFVVYGRLVRQIIPFLAITAANGLVLYSNTNKFTKNIALIIMFIIIVQGLINFRTSFMVSYPREFVNAAQERFPDLEVPMSRSPLDQLPVCISSNYVITNINYPYPLPENKLTLDEDPLMSVPHPVNFLPYQYEAYTPEDREIFRRENIKMEVYQLDPENYAELFSGIEDCHSTDP